jgi:membrane protein implicated in regulation of membrane protease activity
VVRQLLAILAAAASALVAALMFCAWLLALTWDGPWRSWTAAGLMLAFAAIAAMLAWPLLRRRSRPEAELFARVRQEWSRDRDIIERAMDGGEHAAG